MFGHFLSSSLVGFAVLGKVSARRNGILDIQKMVKNGFQTIANNGVVDVGPCPEDFSLLEGGEKCWKQKFAEPEAFCPDGVEQLGLDCVVSAAQKFTCPEGSFADGDMCMQTIRARKDPSCEDGYDLVHRNGTPVCQRVREVAVRPSCQNGWFFEGGSCWKGLRSVPFLKCLVGERLSGKWCLSEVETTCSDADHHRMLLHRTRMDGPIAQAHQCFQTIRRPAAFSCAQGIFKKDRCVVPEPSPAEYNCPGVYDAKITCHHVETVSPQWTCLAGYDETWVYDDLCHCTSVVPVPPVPECPTGFELIAPGALLPPPSDFFGMDLDVMLGQSAGGHFAAPMSGHDECFHFFPAAIRCPEGYNLDDNVCVQTCYMEAKVVYVPHIETCTDCE